MLPTEEGDTEGRYGWGTTLILPPRAAAAWADPPGSRPSSVSRPKNARAYGEWDVRLRTSCQSNCSRTARTIVRSGSKSRSTREVEGVAEGLKAVALCPVRVVLLHYAPTASMLEGEPPGIWAFLGSDRLAAPIVEHGPDLVLHGHAHAGRFEGAIGEVPVFNVSAPVMGQDFWIFELSGVARSSTPVH
jgi:hypothetical protein